MTRIWIFVEYSVGKQSVVAGVGLFYLDFSSQKPKKNKEKKVKKTKIKNKEAKYSINKEYLKKGLVKNVTPTITLFFEYVKRYLSIDKLILDVCWASSDPASCAINFGRLTAVLHGVLALMKANLKVKQISVDTSLNFESEKPDVYLKGMISIAIWQVAFMSFKVLRRLFQNISLRKVVHLHGKQSSNQ